MAANRIQLQHALHKPYDRVLFAKEVLSPLFSSSFTLNSSLIPAPVVPNKSESVAIDKVWIYGSILLDDSTEITCYEVLLQPTVRIEHSKVAIQQYVRKLLTAGQAAFINFVAPANNNVWRLTLVAKDSILTDQGVKEKTTNPKRYTFLLGPSETCKTAAERFEVLSTEKEVTFQTLVTAFSVEKLSKAFFDEYTLHYQNFCNYLQASNYRKSVFNISFSESASQQEKDTACKPIRDFVKKLLGRIVFLYFVQKKGWLGASNTNYTDGLGDFIKQLFDQSGGDATFYSNWLSVLFFNTLNKDRTNDDFKMPDGTIVKVPFLNGGLFDKEAFDEHILTFQPTLFHHPDFEDDILTAKSKGNARGFLNFLDAFNFTVYEDSPDDHTIAVDPEMLGHIFENLLEDNKDKGAFYTPKAIVHYMCQESLTEYLCTTLQITDENAERKAINRLLKDKVIDDLLTPEIPELEKALNNVKICDPAIGSGAFPMGLLQEIFSIKELIAYQTGKDWQPAETKLNIIQNSIYGVDIEKGAVDIARLRFWLSLVVDEEKPRALPNLDYKIVVGDSLISKFDGEIVEIDWERKQSVGKANDFVKNVQRLLVHVADRQKQYFNPDNNNKKQLQTEIRNLKIELLINQLSFNKEQYIGKTVQKGGFMPTAADIKHNTERELQIANFNTLINKLKNLLKNPNEPFQHFDWKLDFPSVLNPYLVDGKGGFDIVIGNPPYVQLQKNEGFLANQLEKQAYQTFERTGDIYSLFYERGIHLLKLNGVLTYITSNKWMRAGYGKSTRAFFCQHQPLTLIDLGSGIFASATVDTNILTIRKSAQKPDTYALKALDISKEKNISFYDSFENRWCILRSLTHDTWTIANPTEQNIKAKIERIGKPLKEWDINIYRGVLTGFNEAFIIDGKKKDELIAQDPRSAEIIKPLLRGRDIKRYKAKFADLWLIATFPALKLNIDNYPAVKEHLQSFGKRLHQTGEEFVDKNGQISKSRKKTGNKWFETQDPIGYYQEFEKEIIVWKAVGRNLTFCLWGKGSYLTAPASFISTNYKALTLFLLAIFQSKYALHFIIKNADTTGAGDVMLNIQSMEKLFIPNIAKKDQQPFAILVEEILKKKGQNTDTTDLEQEIDNLVYKLYELTYDEVKVIDPAFSLSEAEYEAINLE